MTAPTRLTELEAVNIILSVLGESPVNDLSGSNTGDVALAVQILNETLREVQAWGWHFNTEYDYPLVPDNDGIITIPENWIQVDVNNKPNLDVTIRGLRLYSRRNHSYVFTSTLYGEVIMYLSFEDIPECARWFITIRAARKFQDRHLGSELLHKFSENDETQARALLELAESNAADYSIFDNYDIYRINKGYQK